MQANLYLTRDVRELDRLAIEEHGIPGFTLMQRAGRAAFGTLRRTWPKASTVPVFCGGGNNGGDGYIVAGLAREHGMDTTVFHLGKPERLQGAARQAFAYARGAGVPIKSFDPASARAAFGSPDDTVLVDALLGTGLAGPVREDYRRAIDFINSSGLPVLAVDVPSGLDGDTGQSLGAVVNADLTVSFIGLKLGLDRGCGPSRRGELVYDDLEVPEEIFSKVTPAGKLDRPGT